MELQSLISNLTNPTLLFFILGIIAVVIKSDLEIPPTTSKFISYYLLLSIGFKGGQELSHSIITNEIIFTLLFSMAISTFIPFIVFFLLKHKLTIPNAGAIAAAYGSVSAVTFVAATSYLESKNISFGGHMVAAMALMEAPAIIVGVTLISLFDKRPDTKKISLPTVFHHTLTNGSILLILGSLLIGLFSDAKQAEGIKPFTTDIFKGFLAVFLLDMGMLTAKRFSAFRNNGLLLSFYAILLPIFFGSLIAILSGYFIHDDGNRFLITMLGASASYIAVPAAMRFAAPDSDPGLYIPMALGITFPFNISFGMFWYLYLIYQF